MKTAIEILVFTTLLLQGAPATAQELARRGASKPFDLNALTQENKQSISDAAMIAGINCPKVIGASKNGEDSKGWIIRISCAAQDVSSTWDIRMTGYPLTPPRFEAW